jgi:hypothetical protein
MRGPAGPGAPASPGAVRRQPGSEHADLNLYLTDGFDNDQVVVHVDGRKVFEAEGVTTRKLLGLARQLDPVSVAGNTARLDIELPKKGLSAIISADLTRGSHVTVAVENGRLTHSVHKQIGFA